MYDIAVDVSCDHYRISTDRSRLDVPFIHHWLCTESYWAQGRPLETVQRSIENSLCFGVYDGDQQVGFARVVTDYVTFAWLCDVFIAGSHRGRGLGKWLIETITAQPGLVNLKNFILATRDAHGLYRNHGGFETLQNPDRWMARVKRN
jgi:GNAT superfamily N-acetyltransferase